MSRCLSHLGLDSLGKHETPLNIQMIICGMLEISGILLENFYQAVGSLHTPLLSAMPWDLTHVKLPGKREAHHRDQTAHTAQVSHPLLLGCTSQAKTHVPSLYKPLQMLPSLL